MVPSDLHEADASVRFCVWHVHAFRQDSRVRAPCGYITSLFVNRMTRAQERSRAGRWSWPLMAGRIVLLLTEAR